MLHHLSRLEPRWIACLGIEMVRGPWGGLILRLLIISGGVGYIVSVPDGQVFSHRIVQLFGLTDSNPIMRYFSVVDFLAALALGILISHALFWPCIARRKTSWPRWGEPALRALDYLWYAGAAAGLVYVAAQAQGKLAAEVRSIREVELQRHREQFTNSLEDAATRCRGSLLPPPADASAHHKTAYAFVQAVCTEVEEAGPGLLGELWIIDDAILSRCDQAGVQYWPDSWGPSFPDDLEKNLSVFDDYQSFHRVCYNDFHIRRITEKIDEIEPFEAAVAFAEDNPLFSGYVTLFAFLLAFRLARTTAEVAEALRSAISLKA